MHPGEEGAALASPFDDLITNWLAAINAKDAARLASMVTEDCVFLAPGVPPMRGRKTIEQLYTTIFARYTVLQDFRPQEAQVTDDWALAWGVDDITMTPLDGGESMHYVGHGVSVLRRNADGAWKFALGINNAMRQPS